MIQIQHNLAKAQKKLAELTWKKLPRSAASALDRCAYLARQKLIQEFPQHFTVRSPWVQRQLRYKKAEVSQWPKLKSRVGSLFKPMYYQEHGGIKSAQSSIGIGVPRGIKKDPRETLRNRMPEQLLKRKGYRIIHVKGKDFLIFRNGRRKKSMRKVSESRRVQGRTQILYRMMKSVRYLPKWGMEKTVFQMVAQNYTQEMERKLAR